jgi:hypothetical protein
VAFAGDGSLQQDTNFGHSACMLRGNLTWQLTCMGFEKTDSGQDNKAKMFAGKREIEHNDTMSDTIKLKLNTAAVKTPKNG